MSYNFDQIIDRSGTFAMTTDGYEGYLFPKGTLINNRYDDFVHMWVADMGFAVAPEILDAIKQRVDHGILGYTMLIDETYKQTFNTWCEREYGINFNPETIVTTDGVIPALYNIAKIVCGRSGSIIMQTPAYGFFKHAADFYDIPLVFNPLINQDGHYEIDFDDLDQKTQDPEVKLFFFCNPHNPTGRVWSESELKRMAEICFKNDVFIVSDEIHCDLIRSDVQFTPMHKLFPDSNQIMTCMAPSKTFNLAGMKFANIIIPNPTLLNIWHRDLYQAVNPLSVAAAMAAYEHGYEWLQELKQYLDTNFHFLDYYLKSKLPLAKFKISEATYLAWVDLAAYFEKPINLTLFFAEHGVLLEGGDMFVDNADGYIRLNLACPRSVVEKGLNRISEAIHSF